MILIEEQIRNKIANKSHFPIFCFHSVSFLALTYNRDFLNQLPTRIFFLVRRLYLNFQEPLQPKEKQAFFNSYKDKEKLIGRQICLPKYSLL